MADSIQEQVFQGVESALDGVGKPTGLTVHREPAVPLEEDAEKALVLYPQSRATGPGDHGVSVEHRLGLVVEIRRRLTTAERAAGTSASQAMDELYQWAVTSLHEWFQSQTLGVTDLVETGMEWNQKLQNRLHGNAAVTWELRFQVAEDDPTTATS